MLTLHINPAFLPRPDFVRVVTDPHDSSKDMKILRENAERAFRRGTLDFDLTSGTYYLREPRS